MFVTGGGREDLELVFRKLRQGGAPDLLVELRNMPFGVHGRLTDQYGAEWFFRGGS